MNYRLSIVLRLVALLATTTSLTACGDALHRLSRIGQEPHITPVQNPAERMPHISMPMPTPSTAERAPNSLWRAGARAFLKDQRASQVGDILTVFIRRSDGAEDAAELSGTTSRVRNNTEETGATNLLGYESRIWNKLPGTQAAVDPTALLGLNGNTNQGGTGTTSRTDELNVRIAAVVTQVLPNGNLVIQGSQEIRINFETRVLQVAGVVRPADIKSTNEINHDKIAEARFSYGGRGQATDMMQPRYGNQILDILMPF